MTVQAPTTAARRTILGAAALGAIVRGIAYMPWTSASSGVRQLTPVEAWMPLHAWGWIWVAVGVMLASAMICPKLRITAMSILTGLLTMWGMSYLWAWAFEDVQRSWVTSALFLMTAVWSGALTSLLERRR